MPSKSSQKYNLKAIFLNLSKAFDTVCENNLLNIMEHVGICGIIITWFRSYFSFKTQYVCINNEICDSGCLTIAVPRVSFSVNYFFLFYRNDTKLCCELLNCVQYADDTTLCVSGDNLNIICNPMNVQLEKIHHWLRPNKLSLNID